MFDVISCVPKPKKNLARALLQETRMACWQWRIPPVCHETPMAFRLHNFGQVAVAQQNGALGGFNCLGPVRDNDARDLQLAYRGVDLGLERGIKMRCAF